MKAFVLLGLLSLSAIYGYAKGETLIRKVEIPFSFSVRDKTFPAGTYTISRVNQDKTLILIRSEDGREAVNISTFPVRANEVQKTGKLIFHRYGEVYFLSQIWESDGIQGRQLSKSRTERSIEREMEKGADRLSIVDIVPNP
jgi:hypothetical protein